MNNAPVLGKLIETEQQRDAIHVAVAPVVAGEKLSPGDHIGFLPDGRVGEVDNTIGVVDPFLRKIVKPGETVWMLLYPQTVTNLRHDWTHPEFEKKQPPPEKSVSEQWLRAYAARFNKHIEPEQAFQVLIDDVDMKRILYRGTDMHGPSDLQDSEELFKHLSIYLGRPVSINDFEEFTCSC